jgi:hypothetical protein
VVCAAKDRSAPFEQPTERERSVVRVIVSAAAIVLILAVGIVIWSDNRTKTRRALETEALRSVFEESARRARFSAQHFAYGDAESILLEFENQLHRASTPQHDLDAKFDLVMSEVNSAKRDYTAKLDMGWIVFEGRLISGNDHKDILATRQRQHELREAEERRLAENQEKWEKFRNENLYLFLPERTPRDSMVESFISNHGGGVRSMR